MFFCLFRYDAQEFGFPLFCFLFSYTTCVLLFSVIKALYDFPLMWINEHS